uniref:Transposase n=1 Tax=Ditylenchus dipsaci TaxID=166011 RepID=A0A915DWQ7_9BILA
MSTPNKRRAFSLEFKKEVIDAAEKNGNQSALARNSKFQNQAWNILKVKESILKAVADGKKSSCYGSFTNETLI